ncbi:hypothetical protein GCM10017781_26320 [Deinococcus metalli]|uniref:Uncharacterized protein n=1 Tax=Deinococcus metalli TaxID=1141878 RepID=A0ABQ3JPF2_9DEIO|nr:hypothetical protein GCM10017781_26320 [Deinococcus metalli]
MDVSNGPKGTLDLAGETAIKALGYVVDAISSSPNDTKMPSAASSRSADEETAHRGDFEPLTHHFDDVEVTSWFSAMQGPPACVAAKHGPCLPLALPCIPLPAGGW